MFTWFDIFLSLSYFYSTHTYTVFLGKNGEDEYAKRYHQAKMWVGRI
jgi:hypothetical protein